MSEKPTETKVKNQEIESHRRLNAKAVWELVIKAVSAFGFVITFGVGLYQYFSKNSEDYKKEI